MTWYVPHYDHTPSHPWAYLSRPAGDDAPDERSNEDTGEVGETPRPPFREEVSTELTLIPPSAIPVKPPVEQSAYRKLKMKHRQIVALHLSGHSNVQIEKLFGYSPGYVSGVLTNPTTKLLLERCYTDFDMELKALVPKAIRTLGKNMECGDPAVEVRAATEVLSVNGKYEAREHQQTTAEDVIERVLEVVDPDGTRFTIAERRLSRVAGMAISRGENEEI